MDMRELKGLEIAARSQLAFENGAWLVPSQSSSARYRVTLNPDSCQCEDFTLRQQACKHVHAARIVRERDGGPKVTMDTGFVPKPPTYRQNWPAYNQAETEEKHRFQVLIHDLCRGLAPLPHKTGRPRTPTGDAVFAMTFKVFSTMSSRRFTCDLIDAHEKGYVSKPIHYNSINNYLYS